MSASQNTTNYGFPKFLGTDKPAWLVDFNGAMDDIDSTIKTVADLLATLDGTVATNTGDISQLVTDLESASGNITALQSLVATNIANIATKAPIANPNFTGNISLNGNSILTKLNAIINGNFSVNQRQKSGTVILTAGQYGHDRWKAGASGCTYTFNTVENVTTITIVSGSLIQIIDGINLETGTYVLSWVGSSQGKIGAGSYGDTGITGAVTGGTNLSIEFGTGSLSKVRFNIGTTPIEWQTELFSDVLRQCQRYYWRVNGESGGNVVGFGMFISTNQFVIQIPLKETMRTKAISVENNNNTVSDGLNVYTVNSVTLWQSNENNASLIISTNTATAFRPSYMRNLDGTSYLGISAEL